MAYSASKGAMTSLTLSMARQYVDQGVTCNGVAPCYVFGPMIIDALSEEKRAELLEMIPVQYHLPVTGVAGATGASSGLALTSTRLAQVKKFCTPEEVAHCVNFLVSPLAGFVTGEIIDQNGGFQMD